MPNYVRPRINGARVFVTVTLAQRGSQTLIDHIEALRHAVKATRAERPFGIDAWVVLPDHFHAVWSLPAGDRDFSTRMAAIKARFTRAVRTRCRVGFHPTDAPGSGVGPVGWNPTLRSPSKVRKGDAGLWQRRFWEHHIRDQADWENHVAYCWHNPIKHGLVEHPGDWPFSSWHRDVGSLPLGGV